MPVELRSNGQPKGLSLRGSSSVQADGKSALQFLDENGKVLSEFTGQKK